MKTINSKMQEVQRIPRRKLQRKPPKHIIRLLKTNEEENILKVARPENDKSHKGNNNKNDC